MSWLSNVLSLARSRRSDLPALRAYEVDDPEGYAGTKTVMASDAFDAVRVAGKEWAFHHARFRTVTVRVAATREWLTVGHQGGRAVLL